MWPWGVLALLIAVVVLVGLYVNTLRAHARESSDLGISDRAPARKRHPERPRNLGEFLPHKGKRHHRR